MKIRNWCKNLSAMLVVAGIWLPNVSYAANIPLGDPSFEAFIVPANPGYAYSDTYRPTSAWVDDLDSPPDGTGGPSDYYLQDDGASNWLYNAAYAASGVRPIPRSGNQAMHGLGYYNAQETSAVFEAGKTYTFSLYHRADSDATFSGVFMYIFDGSVPFSDPNALANALHTPSPIASWVPISISHTVSPGAPEIGKPVGVAFFARSDSAVDDASLTAIPEPTTIALVGMSGVGLIALRRRRYGR
jgi:hypothetical protein